MGWTEVVIAMAGILGTLVGTFAGIRAERTRWEQEQRARFHPDRYAKYVQLLQALTALTQVKHDSPEEASLLEAANEIYAHVQLLSSEPVKEAAEAFFSRAFDASYAELGGSGAVMRTSVSRAASMRPAPPRRGAPT